MSNTFLLMAGHAASAASRDYGLSSAALRVYRKSRLIKFSARGDLTVAIIIQVNGARSQNKSIATTPILHDDWLKSLVASPLLKNWAEDVPPFYRAGRRGYASPQWRKPITSDTV
jgi:hypothetical protein